MVEAGGCAVGNPPASTLAAPALVAGEPHNSSSYIVAAVVPGNVAPDENFPIGLHHYCINTSTVVDLSTGQTVTSIPVGEQPFDVTASIDGKRIYAAAFWIRS